MAKAKVKSAPRERSVNIVIVDDHPIVRHGLAQLINSEPGFEVCGEAETASDAMAVIEGSSADIALIDIALGEGNGIELIKQIKARGLPTKTLVVSMHNERLYAERAIAAGAMGYVHKDEAIDHILTAIRRVVDGKLYLSESIADLILKRVIHHEPEQGLSPIETLSDRELEVFELIGRGLSTKQIADEMFLSIKTVETYRQRIKVKLNLSGSHELTVFAAQWVIDR